MNARSGFLMVLLAAVFTFGLIRLYSFRLATGDVYPPYSSMRAGPDGAKLLYESLARTAGVTVARNYLPLEYMEGSDAAVLFLDLNLAELLADPEPLERLANSGARVLITFGWTAKEKPSKSEDLEKKWRFRFGFDSGPKSRHRLYFADSPEWRVLDRDGSKIVAMERTFQKGSVVLFAGSRDFSNESTVQSDRLALVCGAIGPATRVVFDEQHFGVEESGTVVGLAGRFRLYGMAIGLAICAALFIWKNSASFPPPGAAHRVESLSGRTSISGLVTLLRRHIKPADLAATCWNEWLAGNRADLTPARRERAETILRERSREPLVAVREIQIVLHSKGPL